MPTFHPVTTVDQLPPGTMRSFTVHHTRVVLCNVGGAFYAIADECTHDGAPISTGRLFKEQVVCPRHGARFNVTTGAVEAPPAVVPL